MPSREVLTPIKVKELEDRLGFSFQNPELLYRALRHSSIVRGHSRNEDVQESNERLEFLGDAILGLILSKALLTRPEHLSEGVMSRLRAALVNERSLAQCARTLGLGAQLRMSRGEERSGGRNKDSVLADALEALIAAIFLDQGYVTAESFVLSMFSEELKGSLVATDVRDYKTALQELTQSLIKSAPEYRVVAQIGPDHCTSFEVEVLLRGQILGAGRGVSKKRASQEAARDALGQIERDPALMAGHHAHEQETETR